MLERHADQPHEPGAERLAPGVVAHAAGEDLIDGDGDVVGLDGGGSPRREEPDRLGGPIERGPQRPCRHRRHPGVAEELGAVGIVDGRSAADAHEAGQGGLAHARLTERREDLADVAQERRVGADHQDPLLGEALPVLVEEEGGAVQAHRRLAGAGTALHHEAPLDRRADHDVLLGGDRGDDVAHLAAPRPLELGQQWVGHTAMGGVDAVGVVEVLVEERLDPGPVGGEPPAQPQPLRVGRGGPVEGRSHGRPPVDHQRVAGRGLDVAPADAVALLVAGEVVGVDAPEGQAGNVDHELAEAAPEVSLGGVRIHLPGCGVGRSDADSPLGAVAHGREGAIGPVEVRLLARQFPVRIHGGGRRYRRATARTTVFSNEWRSR